MKPTRIAAILLLSAVWLRAQTPPPLEVGLDVNAQSDSVVAPGWPLLIRAAVVSVDGQPVAVGVNGGPWTQALHLTIIDQNGVAQN
jgi:hypothetical protein